MKKYLVEFIGTFFLVFTVGCTVIAPGAGAFAPIAIGAALMVMVFAGGHVSGAHFNPAVTLAVAIRGRCPKSDIAPYWIAQIAAALVAAWAVHFFKDGMEVAALPIGVKGALLAEFLFTFALCWVVLNVATSKGTIGNSFYGIAIGATVMAGAFAVGPISGGAFNPAVATGITVMGLAPWSHIWIYLIGEGAAAVAAALAYKIVNGGD
ncbi:MAG TPA: aquaporin [Opitutaceae bacterium]|nr:aquaporin [Opitutaceae bacterium]